VRQDEGTPEKAARQQLSDGPPRETLKMAMRFWFYPCFLLLLGGCTTTPFFAPSTPVDQQLFVQGMEEVNLQRDVPPAFSALHETYAESPWVPMAETVKELLTTIREQQQVINRLESEKAASRKEMAALKQQKDSLAKDLDKLKRLLIDLERRGR
jgi:hypothetical protein